MGAAQLDTPPASGLIVGRSRIFEVTAPGVAGCATRMPLPQGKGCRSLPAVTAFLRVDNDPQGPPFPGMVVLDFAIRVQSETRFNC